MCVMCMFQYGTGKYGICNNDHQHIGESECARARWANKIAEVSTFLNTELGCLCACNG